MTLLPDTLTALANQGASLRVDAKRVSQNQLHQLAAAVADAGWHARHRQCRHIPRHVTDRTTSHSTRRANNARQVAGYGEASRLRERVCERRSQSA